MPNRFLLPLLGLMFSAVTTIYAQMEVSLEMTRSLYMIHEPMLAKVTITNLSGRDQNFSDAPGRPWFAFEVFAGQETLIPPANPNYKLEDLYVPAGKSVKRTINVTPLYSLQEFGSHSIRAVIFDREKEKYYTSNRHAFEITEGLLLWKQSVGVASDNSTRTYSLLTHRLPAENRLYVRIIDDTGKRIMGCYSIGRVLSFSPPEHLLDGQNNLHVLQMIGPKAYLYTKISPDGEMVDRQPYLDSKSNPHLARAESGDVKVRGGKIDLPVPPEQQKKAPRLSDRPIGV